MQRHLENKKHLQKESGNNVVSLFIRVEALWHTTSQLYTNVTVEVSTCTESYHGLEVQCQGPMSRNVVVGMSPECSDIKNE